MKTTWELESIEDLKRLFPEGKANGDNICLFSTSGVHGSYTKIEDLCFEPDENGEVNNMLTVLAIQPRRVNTAYGTIKVSKEDIEWLKTLRESSWKEMNFIGRKQ